MHSNEKEQKKEKLSLLHSFLPASLPPHAYGAQWGKGLLGGVPQSDFPPLSARPHPILPKAISTNSASWLAHGQTGVPFLLASFFFFFPPFFSSRHDLFSYLYSHERIIPFLLSCPRHLFVFFFSSCHDTGYGSGFLFSLLFLQTDQSGDTHTHTCTKRSVADALRQIPQIRYTLSSLANSGT